MPLTRRIERPATTLAGLLSLVTLLGFVPRPQEATGTGPDREAPTAELPADLAARIDGELTITFDEYKTHLLTLYGRGPLQELVYQKLLDREAALLGLEIDSSLVQEQLDEQWRRYVDIRHQGNLDAVQSELELGGFTPESYRNLMRVEIERKVREDALILAGRAFTDEDLRARFDQTYGMGGVAVEVRHLFLNRARMSKELERLGIDPREMTPEELDRRLMLRAEELRAEVAAGADFESLVRQYSHDLSVGQNGGIIPNYNYRRYGEPLARAVRAAEVGSVSAPVPTVAGVHLIRVESRTVTSFETVRETLRATLLDEEPSMTERGELRARLFAAAKIETF